MVFSILQMPNWPTVIACSAGQSPAKQNSITDESRPDRSNWNLRQQCPTRRPQGHIESTYSATDPPLNRAMGAITATGWSVGLA